MVFKQKKNWKKLNGTRDLPPFMEKNILNSHFLFLNLSTQHRYQQCNVMIFVLINTWLQTPVSRPKAGRAFNQSKRGEETMSLVSGRKTELIIYNLFLLCVLISSMVPWSGYWFVCLCYWHVISLCLMVKIQTFFSSKPERQHSRMSPMMLG